MADNDFINLSPDDTDTPFSAPVDPVADASEDIDNRASANELDDTHPNTDVATDISQQQYYDEGLAGASEASEPNASNTVVGYDPSRDQRKIGHSE